MAQQSHQSPRAGGAKGQSTATEGKHTHIHTRTSMMIGPPLAATDIFQPAIYTKDQGSTDDHKSKEKSVLPSPPPPASETTGHTHSRQTCVGRAATQTDQGAFMKSEYTHTHTHTHTQTRSPNTGRESGTEEELFVQTEAEPRRRHLQNLEPVGLRK